MYAYHVNIVDVDDNDSNENNESDFNGTSKVK